jgi:hypothetical protein
LSWPLSVFGVWAAAADDPTSAMNANHACMLVIGVLSRAAYREREFALTAGAAQSVA